MAAISLSSLVQDVVQNVSPGGGGSSPALPADPHVQPRTVNLKTFTPHPYPPLDVDTTFHLDLVTSLEVESHNGRRRGDTLNYAENPKVGAADGYNLSSSFACDGSSIGLYLPGEGIFPTDEWTAVFKVWNNSGSAFDAAAFPGNQWLINTAFIAYRSAAGQIFFMGPGGRSLTVLQQAGAWANNVWRTFTVYYQRNPYLFEVQVDGDYAGRYIGTGGAAPSATRIHGGPASSAVGAANSGLQIGGQVNAHYFRVSDLNIYATKRTHNTNGVDSASGPAVIVDANTSEGAWPEMFGGCLALYEGFGEAPEVTYTATRDKQFDLVFNQAGVRFVRASFGLTDLGAITGAYPNFNYNWAALDAKMDAYVAANPDIKILVNMGYTPALLNASAIGNPSSHTNFARIQVDFFDHVRDYLGDNLYGFSGWNEPDLDQYWTGTDQQHYDLWKTVQNLLISEYPADSMMRMATPEYAHDTGHAAFFTWLTGESSTLKNSIRSIQIHDFQWSLGLLQDAINNIRDDATAAGLSANVPMEITELGPILGVAGEQHNNPNSWWAAQPSPTMTVYCAAHAIASMVIALNEPASNLQVCNFGSIGTFSFYWGEMGFVTSDEDSRPMPLLSAAAMANTLTGDRVNAITNRPHLHAVASKDASGNIVIVYASYYPWRGYTARNKFELSVDGLPASFTWRHVKLDAFVQGDRMVVAGAGDQTNLPHHVEIGNLGVGMILISESV